MAQISLSFWFLIIFGFWDHTILSFESKLDPQVLKTAFFSISDKALASNAFKHKCVTVNL
jgi:hypothetical protein